MYPASKLKKPLQTLVAGLVFWMLPGLALSAGDDYLSLLEAEAGEMDDKPRAPVMPVSKKQPVKVQHAKNINVIQPGLDFDAFESELDSNYSGSHFLYVKLSNTRRKEVYTVYQQDNRISVIREEIVRLLSSS